MLKTIKKIAAVMAIGAIMVSMLSFSSIAKPKDCFMVCGPVPFPPGYACWEICR
jgi:hypothetical protein